MCAWCLTCITSCHSSNGILRCAFGPPFFKCKQAGRRCNQIAKSRSHQQQVTGLWGSRYQVVQDVFSYNVLIFSVNMKLRRGVTSLPRLIAWGWNLLHVCKWTQYLKNSGLAAVCEAGTIHVKHLSNWRRWWLLERVSEGCLLESQLCGRGIIPWPDLWVLKGASFRLLIAWVLVEQTGKAVEEMSLRRSS